MKPTEALQNIEAALNAAAQKGVFASLEAATFVFNCLQVVRQELAATAQPAAQNEGQKN